jgi:hypothetical protein
MFQHVIQFQSINKMRYDTVGDWEFVEGEDGNIIVSVASTDDEKTNELVAIHELVEAVLCKHAGVRQEDVNNFDLSHLDEDEPGLNPNAPYYIQHLIATSVEMLLAAAMGVDWNAHEYRLEQLIKQRRKHGDAS